MTSDIKMLSVPEIESVRYERNFIKTAVCELRFPTLLVLEKDIPPALQGTLRKEYPFFKRQKTFDVARGEAGESEARYLFNSKKKDWTVSLRSSSISIETNNYTEFDVFLDRLNSLIKKTKRFIDSDFFTRVGLRYINEVPIADGDIDGWINQDLVAPLLTGHLGTATHCFSEIKGFIDVGRYSFRHGLRSDKSNPDLTQYFLDFDYYDENVETSDALALSQKLNEINFSFFRWCLGPKALEYLGEPRPKGKS